MSKFVITFDGFDPAEEGHREALCALGNGYLVTRGAAPEATADGSPLPRHVRRGRLQPPGHRGRRAGASRTRAS